MADEKKPPTYEITKRDTRPKLTEEIMVRLCVSIVGGASVPEACEANGLSWNTCKRWLALGKEGKKPYVALVEAIAEAKARWEVSSVAAITKHGRTKDWKALAWLLERRRPDLYWKPEKPPETQQKGPDVVFFYPAPAPPGALPAQPPAMPSGPALVFPPLSAPDTPVEAEGEDA